MRLRTRPSALGERLRQLAEQSANAVAGPAQRIGSALSATGRCEAAGAKVTPLEPYAAGGRRRSPDLRRRLIGLLVVVCLAFAGVGVRLAIIQGPGASSYVKHGEKQRLRTVTLQARRGSIFDRERRELALSVDQKTLWADPTEVVDPVSTAQALAPVLDAKASDIQAALTRGGRFSYIARKIDPDIAERAMALKKAGIHTLEEPKRFLPAGPLAEPVVGGVNIDSKGQEGLELQYDSYLSGKPGEMIVERDQTGRYEIAAGKRQLIAARQGEDLVLTIDRSLQYETEKALANEIERSHAKGGIAVVANPTNGEILAMANLVASEKSSPAPAKKNLAVANVYEPGSVNKLITVAGALEERLVDPSTMFDVPDNYQVSDTVFHDHERHPLKQWSVTDIMANSSNVGTIMIGQRLGKAKLDSYLRAFRLGAKSGLDFPGESAGILLDPKNWSGTSIATVPIGQGLSVTALQMLNAYNAVANDGVWIKPVLVKSTIDARGREHSVASPEHRRVISFQTARQVNAMLAEVVRAGTGKEAAVPGYTVAGKTGTARKPNEGTKGYKEGAYVATFAGFLPAEAPQLSAIVILDEPTPIYGGLVSAPVFAQVARYALRLLQIPPPPGGPQVSVPAVDVSSARAEAEVDGAAREPTTTLLSSPARTPSTLPPSSRNSAVGTPSSRITKPSPSTRTPSSRTNKPSPSSPNPRN